MKYEFRIQQKKDGRINEVVMMAWYANILAGGEFV